MIKADNTPAATREGDAPATVDIADFAKLDLRIGHVLECDVVEGSDKLLRFKLDAGELGERQIFSGIRAAYGSLPSWSDARSGVHRQFGSAQMRFAESPRA